MEMSLSRTLYDARTEKDIAIQQALNQARAEMNEKIGATPRRHCILVSRSSVLFLFCVILSCMI